MRGAALLVSVAALLVVAPAAEACTCASQGSPVEDAEAILADSDGAFIGVLRSVRVLDQGNPNSDAIFRYRVRREFSIELGRHVRVRASISSAACGLPSERRRKYALGITGRRGAWRSNLCSIADPRALKEAAASAALRTDRVACP